MRSQEPKNVRILAGPFRGAKLILAPAHSKRKIVGVYEHVLNPWLKKVLKIASGAIDVGANDGYFTYGCAHAIAKARGRGHVIALEPGLEYFEGLRTPAQWPQYSGIQFEFLAKFAGNVDDGNTTTLESLVSERESLLRETLLVKVDVEGAEMDVLEGAGPLLSPPHHWVVEVHGKERIKPCRKLLEAASREVELIEPKPHWLFGPETRTEKTFWFVTKIP